MKGVFHATAISLVSRCCAFALELQERAKKMLDSVVSN